MNFLFFCLCDGAGSRAGDIFSVPLAAGEWALMAAIEAAVAPFKKSRREGPVGFILDFRMAFISLQNKNDDLDSLPNVALLAPGCYGLSHFTNHSMAVWRDVGVTAWPVFS